MSPLSLLKQYNIIFAELRQIEAARPSESSLQSRLQHMQAGSIKFHDARQLVRLLETLRPQRILEVGSFVGVSSRLLLEASTPWQAEVVALDPNMRHRGIDQPAEVVRALNHAFLGKRLVMVEAFFDQVNLAGFYYEYEAHKPQLDHAKVDALVAQRPVIDASWSERFDMIFIDGAHDAEAVLGNYHLARSLLKEGGLMVFHDACSWHSVTQVILDIRSRGEDHVTFFGWTARLLASLLPTRMLRRIVPDRWEAPVSFGVDGLAVIRPLVNDA